MKFSFNTSTYVKKGRKNFRPLAQCDMTGFPVSHSDLVPYYEWGGDSLYNTGLLVHKDFVDLPQIAGRTPIIFHDPTPVNNPRPFAFFEWGREIPIEGED
jgi:hypothetical protein